MLFKNVNVMKDKEKLENCSRLETKVMITKRGTGEQQNALEGHYWYNWQNWNTDGSSD